MVGTNRTEYHMREGEIFSANWSELTGVGSGVGSFKINHTDEKRCVKSRMNHFSYRSRLLSFEEDI